MAWNGGYNSVELFSEFESLVIAKNKIFVGYSDNTLLINALPAMGVCRSWQGPMLANWVKTPEYGELWAESLYALYVGDFKALTSLYNQKAMTVYRPGKMRGKVWGGNNYTFDLLQGTSFCPNFSKPYILQLEGEDFIVAKDRIWQDFIRNLDSIMLLPGAAENITGLLIGKFPDTYMLNIREVESSFEQRKYLDSIPIIYDFPRGYCQPALPLPLGEELQILLNQDNSIEISRL